MSKRPLFSFLLVAGLVALSPFFPASRAVCQDPAEPAQHQGIAEGTSNQTEAAVDHEAHAEEAHAAEDSHEDHGHAATSGEGHGPEGEHGEGHGDHPPEIPDLLMGFLKVPPYLAVPLYSLFVAVVLVLGFRYLTRNLQRIPTRGQSLVEIYVELMDNFVCSILGKEMGRRYLPFLGTLWIYIWFMNLFCLIPFGFSPTSMLQQTFALSVTVFIYVQYTAFRYQGIGGYLYHLMGEPKDVVGWFLAPLFLPLHVLGEFTKPLSLGLRLRGNIMGEDILLGVFSALGIMLIQAIGWKDPWIGIPLHLPMIALVLLGSTIQATVFTVLSTIYVYMNLPHHEDHDEGHGASHDHGHGQAHAH